MTKLIRRNNFLIWTLIVIFSISVVTIIVFSIINFLWILQVNQPSENNTVDYIKKLNCELVTDNSDKDTYEFSYYTKESSCDFIIHFYKTYYSDVIEDNRDEFEDDTKYNKDIEDLWDFSGFKYHYYSEIGKYYRVFVSENNTVLSVESKNKNKDRVDKIFNNLNINYKYKIFLEFYNNMLFLFIIMIFYYGWQIFVKFGRKGWIVFIPIYNLVCLSDDIFHDKSRAILCFIPIVNIIYFLSILWSFGKYFQKGKSYCWLTMLFPYVFIPLLIFLNYDFCRK